VDFWRPEPHPVSAVTQGARGSSTQGISSHAAPAGCVHTRRPRPPDKAGLKVRRRGGLGQPGRRQTPYV